MVGNQRDRLGMVTALSKATYKFPYRRLGVTGNTRLLAYPIAGRSAYASDPTTASMQLFNRVVTNGTVSITPVGSSPVGPANLGLVP